jgi:hypothetical protein
MVAADNHYDEDATLREARTVYFRRNGFGEDGGYASAWVKVKVAQVVPLWLPNTAGRVRAVRYHDLHHVVTEFATDNRGEAEIGAWELATGCRALPAAWVLNSLAMAYGLVTHPVAVFRAYVRGRNSRNLYARTFDDALLDRRVGEVKDELSLRRAPAPARPGDVVAFAGHVLGATAVGLGFLAPPALLLALVVWLA